MFLSSAAVRHSRKSYRAADPFRSLSMHMTLPASMKLSKFMMFIVLCVQLAREVNVVIAAAATLRMLLSLSDCYHHLLTGDPTLWLLLPPSDCHSNPPTGLLLPSCGCCSHPPPRLLLPSSDCCSHPPTATSTLRLLVPPSRCAICRCHASSTWPVADRHQNF